MVVQRLSPAVAKRFRSGRACLDFVHTGGSMDWVEPELVRDDASLERWLGHVLGIDQVHAQRGDLTEAYRLREALWHLARSRTRNADLEVEDVETLNAFAAGAPPVVRLSAQGALERGVVTVSAGLSAIARDGVGLLAGPLGRRIRVCEDADCAFLFVDASRPGTRRWCSMQRCGNLAKTRAHRAAAAASP